MNPARGPFADAPRLSRKKGGALGVLILLGFLCFIVGVLLLLVGAVAHASALTSTGAVLVVAAVIAIVAVRRPMRKVRDQRVPYLADKFGLSFSPTDPFGLTAAGLPFDVFQQRGVELRNVMWGRILGCELKGFDVRYETYGGSDVGWTYTEWQFAALGELPAECPPLTIVRGPAAATSDRPKVRFESADFDREFTVLCADRRFATALIDQRLMAWLLDGVPRSVVFEV
ncbi:MAG TPA: hypothetical protein VF660_01895, partial [Actinomycetota bacterium]